MNPIKKILLPIVCDVLLTPKSFSDIPLNIKEFKCTQNDISLLLNTSNNIMRVNTSDDVMYFRECKQHLEIHKYVANEINFYYTKICPELIYDKSFIESALSNESKFKKFINMGMTNDIYSGSYNFCMGNGGAYIGLDGIDPEMEERVKDFVQYIWGELYAYKLNCGLKIGQYQTYNSIRAIATYRIAELLGVQCLIPKTEYALITIDNEKHLFGTIMENANGVSTLKINSESKIKMCTPQLQRSLNNLNILDVICLEKDHRPGNYNVILEHDKAVRVIAFDNDSPNSFGVGKISFKTYAGCSPLIINNNINRPYIDKDIAEKILRITDQDLDDTLGDLLNRYQLFSIKQRVKKINKILNLLPAERFLSITDWTDHTVKEEISGKFGTTYLSKFLQNHEEPYQPWIKNT